MNVPVLSLLLRRFSLRHARLAPRATALLVGILALGVAVFVSIRLANRAAVSSFTHFTDTLTGQSDFIVQAPTGTLPESVLRELRTALGVRPVQIIPVVEATAAQAQRPDEAAGFGRTSYTLLGVDLLSLANLASQSKVDRGYFNQNQSQNPGQDLGTGGRAAQNGDDGADAFWRAYNAGPQVWVSAAFAPAVPKSLDLVLDERVRTLTVAGVIPTAKEAPRVPPTLLILDLPHLQMLTGKVGRVDRVEFLIEPGPRAAERRDELKSILETLGGERWLVTTPGARGEVWAFGFRNPFRTAFGPDGMLWVGDVGWEQWEMIYRVKRGGNYGWAITEGPNTRVRTDIKPGPGKLTLYKRLV